MKAWQCEGGGKKIYLVVFCLDKKTIQNRNTLLYKKRQEGVW